MKKRLKRVRPRESGNNVRFQQSRNVKFAQAANENIQPSRLRRRGYVVVGVAERDFSRFDREQAMAEARRLVENDPFIAGIVQTYVDNVAKDGFRLIMNTDDKAWNKDVEMLWDMEKDSLDARNIRPFWKLQRAWQYRKIVDGDIGIYHNNVDIATKQFYVQTIEADRIRSKKYDYLDQGVEFDDLGMPLRYWIGPRPKDQQDIPKILEQGAPVDASDFYLYAHFPTERIDQLRGASMLLPMFNTLKDVREMMNAMLQKVKASAFFALKNITKAGPTGLDWNGIEALKTNEDGKTRRTRQIVPGQIADLGKDEDIQEIESKSPNPEFENFVRLSIRYASAELGMPLELCLIDVANTSYSSMMNLRELAKRRFQCEQASLKIPSSKVFLSWIDNNIQRKVLTPAKSIKLPRLHRWLTPPWPSLDPSRDVNAYGQALGYGLTTIKDILAETSTRSFEELVMQRKEEIEALKAAGIPVTVGLPGSNPTSTPEEDNTPTKEGKTK